MKKSTVAMLMARMSVACGSRVRDVCCVGAAIKGYLPLPGGILSAREFYRECDVTEAWMVADF